MAPADELQSSIHLIQGDLATIKALIQERERSVEENRRNIGLLDKDLRALKDKLHLNDEETHKIDVQFENFKKDFEKMSLKLDSRMENIERHLSAMTETKTQVKLLWGALCAVATALIGGFVAIFFKYFHR